MHAPEFRRSSRSQRSRALALRRPTPGFLLPLLVLLLSGRAEADNLTTVTGKEFACRISSELSQIECSITGSKSLPHFFEAASSDVIHNPDRFYVDLPGMSVPRPESHSVPGSSLIKAVRTGQQKTGARIVIDLNGDASVEKSISADKRSIVFHLLPSVPSAESQKRTEGVSETKAPSPTPHVSQVPSQSPTVPPTLPPTAPPTKSPTRTPTHSPTASPTQSPTVSPTKSPTQSPTKSPSQSPSLTASPSQSPSPTPTKATPRPTPPTPAPTPSTPAPTATPAPTSTAVPSSTPVPPSPSPTRSQSTQTPSPTPEIAVDEAPSPVKLSQGAPPKVFEVKKVPAPPSPAEAAAKANQAHGANVQLAFSGSALQPEKLLQFSADANFISFEPGERPVRDVKLINKTENSLFLYSVVEKGFDVGTEKERYEPTKDLLASPRRLTLLPFGTRQLRLVLASLRPDEGETIYRVSVYPQSDSFGETEVEASVNKVPSTLKVIAGLAILASAPAEDAAATIRSESTATQLSIVNSGTRVAILENCSHCPMSSGECSPLARKLLFPSGSWPIPVSGAGVITCDLKLGKSVDKITVPYGKSEVR